MLQIGNFKSPKMSWSGVYEANFEGLGFKSSDHFQVQFKNSLG